MIEVKNVSKSYGNFKVLKNISFTVHQGEIIGLLGPNGAGKTTTMRTLTGFLSYDEGSISIAGFNPESHPLETRRLIGYLPENPLLYEEQTIYEFLDFVARMKEIKEIASEINRVMEETDIAERKDQLISSLSRGFKQRVGFAAALLGNPAILILDEPTSGLDPNQVVEIRKLIKKMGEEKTIILSTHILPEVEEICQKVIVIDKGSIKAVDTIEELKNKTATEAVCLLKTDDMEKTRSILARLDSVLSYEEIEDGFSLTLDTLSNRNKVLKELVSGGVYEFQTPKVSLEEVFHELTLSEEEQA